MSFRKIAIKITAQKLKEPIEERLCPDQYVGRIDTFANISNDFEIRNSVEERPKDIKCLVMLLESPHMKEFKDIPSPARGTTGKLIRQHILDVKGLSIYSDYGLVLVNAIQNQCSLGYSTELFRDEVFFSFWNDGAKENFIERLKIIYHPGDVIVNCCTKGQKKQEELRKLVHDSIPNDMGTALRRTHPSSWYSKQNRNYEWKIP
jgi:hypothetical protein